MLFVEIPRLPRRTTLCNCKNHEIAGIYLQIAIYIYVYMARRKNRLRRRLFIGQRPVRYRNYARDPLLSRQRRLELFKTMNCVPDPRTFLRRVHGVPSLRRVPCQLFNFEIGQPLQSCRRLNLPNGEHEMKSMKSGLGRF